MRKALTPLRVHHKEVGGASVPSITKRIAALVILVLSVTGAITALTASASATTGFFEICKLADNSNGAVTASSFSYSWSGGSATVPVGSCSPLESAPVGTLTITEATAGYQVSAVTSDPAGRIASTNLDAGTATITLVAGDESTQTVAIFTNKVKPAPAPPPTGYLEVCKDSTNGVTGTFNFSVNGGTAFGVAAGSCSSAIQVPAGTATITEAARTGFALDTATAAPSGRFVSLVGSTETVNIVAGDQSTQTVAHFVNKPVTGEFKVCKAADNSNGTVSGSFTFNLSPASGSTSSVTVPVGSCSLPISYQQGTSVTVSEVLQSGILVKSIGLVPGTAPATTLTSHNEATGTAVVSVGSGISDLTFTNIKPPPTPPPTGEFKVCKAADNSNGTISGSFTFNLSPASGTTSSVTVPVGSCSLPIRYNQGTSVTVTEVLQTGILVKSIVLVPGTAPASTLTSSTTATGTAVVNVGSGISDLTFTNIKPPPTPPPTGQIKVCKAVDNSNGTITGNFTFSVSPASGSTSSVSVPVGQCSQPLTYNQGTSVTISEVLQSGINVKSIVLVPGTAPSSTLTASSTSAGTASVLIGSGTSDLTFTNIKPAPTPPPTVTVCQLSKGYFKNHSDAVTNVSVGTFSITKAQAQAILDVRGNATTGVEFNLANLYQQALASYYNVQAALHAGASASDPLLASVITAYTSVFAHVSFDGTTFTTTLSVEQLSALNDTLSNFSQDVCREFVKGSVS